MKKLPILLVFLFAASLGYSQSSETIRNYIATYKSIAMEEMIRTGVPAAITLAQGIHETGAGQSELVRKSNNHFGIKCKTEWKGESVTHDDDARGECFRKYDDPMDSYRDHSDFLKNRPYYASLFKLDPTDYEAWAYGLKKAGYATNPKYPQILIKLIRDFDLQEYSLAALEGKKDGIILVSNSGTLKTEGSGQAKAVQPAVFVRSKYPSGTFTINDTKVIVIERGTSYLKVAEENDISLPRLFEFNDMAPADIAAQDGLLFLQRKRKKGASEFHIVQPGETLQNISQQEGVRLESLLEYNLLKSGQEPGEGEKIYLQWVAPSAPKLKELKPVLPIPVEKPVPDSLSSAPAPWIIHTVMPKETAYAIAKKYEVEVSDILKWNELSSTDLKIGQQLKINKKPANAN